jgi:hypothetical protein
MSDALQELHDVLNSDDVGIMHVPGRSRPIGFVGDEGASEVWMTYRAAKEILPVLEKHWGGNDHLVKALTGYVGGSDV